MDYLLTRLVGFGTGVLAARAGYFAHQACEKYLKALSLHTGQEYLETHKLQLLADACATEYAFLREPQVGRYGAAAKFDPLAEKTGEFETRGVVVFSPSMIDALDYFVFTLRGKLTFLFIQGWTILLP